MVYIYSAFAGEAHTFLVVSAPSDSSRVCHAAIAALGSEKCSILDRGKRQTHLFSLQEGITSSGDEIFLNCTTI